MPTVNGVECSVIVDGKPVPEYSVDINPDKRTASCFVVAESDKEFKIDLVWEKYNPTASNFKRRLSIKKLRVDGEGQQRGFHHTLYAKVTLNGFQQMLEGCKKLIRPWKFAPLNFSKYPLEREGWNIF